MKSSVVSPSEGIGTEAIGPSEAPRNYVFMPLIDKGEKALAGLRTVALSH
jgi:hypothetical protein